MQRVPSLNETSIHSACRVSTARVGGIELPDRRNGSTSDLYRLGSWLELQDAPTAAVAERLRPRAGVSNRLRPCLPNEGRKHASLREGGLADPRVAEENWKLALRRRERLDHLDCFACSYRRRSPHPIRSSPQGRDRGRCAATTLAAAFRRFLSQLTPAQLCARMPVPPLRSSGVAATLAGRAPAGLPASTRTSWYSTVARLVVFIKLPSTRALFSDQQHERVRLRNFIGKLLATNSHLPAGSWARKRLAPRRPCAAAHPRTPA